MTYYGLRNIESGGEGEGLVGRSEGGQWTSERKFREDEQNKRLTSSENDFKKVSKRVEVHTQLVSIKGPMMEVRRKKRQSRKDRQLEIKSVEGDSVYMKKKQFRKNSIDVDFRQDANKSDTRMICKGLSIKYR